MIANYTNHAANEQGFLVSPPFGMECLTSLADDMAHYALC
jgi:hypothetical protein